LEPDLDRQAGINVPEEADYLAFVADVASSRRLRSLKSAFQAFLPGSPALHVVLENAISAKSPDRPSKAGTMPRPEAKRRVDLDDLPSDWRAVRDDLRLGAVPVHARAPAASVIDSMQDVLREYAKVQIDAGAPVEISLDGVRRYEAARADYAAQRSDPDYADQGNRPATQHTVIQRLRVFGAALGLDPRLLQDLRIHESALRRRMSSSVPLKFGKFDSLPSLTEVWQRATDLLARLNDGSRKQTRCRLINAIEVGQGRRS
jgi:hypothetical protein